MASYSQCLGLEEPLGAVGGLIGGVPFLSERLHERPQQVGFVFDHQHTHRRSPSPMAVQGTTRKASFFLSTRTKPDASALPNSIWASSRTPTGASAGMATSAVTISPFRLIFEASNGPICTQLGVPAGIPPRVGGVSLNRSTWVLPRAALPGVTERMPNSLTPERSALSTIAPVPARRSRWLLLGSGTPA